jgi:hypothetical protein
MKTEKQSETTKLLSNVDKVWFEIVNSLNKGFNEGYISYRELKAGVNNAGLMRQTIYDSLNIECI